VGASLLLVRKAFAKFVVLGAAVCMFLVEFLGFVICLIATSGTFLTHYNADYFLNIVFSLTVAGIIGFLVFNKDVSKALTGARPSCICWTRRCRRWRRTWPSMKPCCSMPRQGARKCCGSGAGRHTPW